MAPVYDITLLLDSNSPEEQRGAILGEIENLIDAQGEVHERHDWGLRGLAYEIDHKRDADYHLIQFSGPRELLDTLTHSLKITDGVVRFRIIRVPPRAAPVPDLFATVAHEEEHPPDE